jgi:hypothetical protein
VALNLSLALSRAQTADHLLASSTNVPAVAFASPGILTAFQVLNVAWRTDDKLNSTVELGATRTLASCVFQIFDEQDPAVQLTVANQTGQYCAYTTATNSACQRCFEHAPDLGHLGVDCDICGLEHHIYKHYLALVFGARLPQTCSSFDHTLSR